MFLNAKRDKMRQWFSAKGYSGSLSDQMQGYFSNLSGLSIGTLHDHVNKVLSASGYSGTTEDMLRQNFVTTTGISNPQDAERAFFDSSNYAFGIGVSGLTFLADSRQLTLNAIAATGTKTSTFAASRAADKPATYVDANGVIQVTTTSNVVRYDYGYYDATGYHAYPAPIARLEGASSNLCRRSDILDGSVGWATGGSGSSAADTSITDIYGLTGAYKLTLPGSADRYFHDTSVAHASSEIITVSFWARSVSGTGTINVRVRKADASVTDNLIDTLSTSWRRFNFSFTASAAGAATTALWFYNDLVASLTTYYVQGVQIEVAAYPSSLIRTTTGALTRNPESLTYVANDGNFPAPSGNNCLSFADSDTSAVTINDSETGNRIYGSTAFSVETWVFPRELASSDGIVVKNAGGTTPNGYKLQIASTSGNLTAVLGETSGKATTTNTTAGNVLTANTWNHIVMTWASGAAPKIYIKSTEATYSATAAVTTPTDDSAYTLYIGRENSGDLNFDGFIRRVRIFRNKALSQADVTALYNGGTYTQVETAADRGVTGATAEYSFSEGTGTTLTDSVAANNGTISGATWSKDTHAGTVVLAYRPVMLPGEQAESYKLLFNYRPAPDVPRSYWVMLYLDNAANGIYAAATSNNNELGNAKSSAGLTRFGLYTLSHVFSTTADGSSKKQRLYLNGTSVADNASYAIPVGSTTNMSIQENANCAMEYIGLAIFNRVLTAAEVTQVYRYFGGT